MASWENEFFRGYPALDVKQEYRKLLSVNLSDAESEQLIIEHFTKRITLDSREEAQMWFSLALIQWQLGRLSEAVRDRALHFLSYPVDWVSTESLGLLKSTLYSPMPEKKKIRLPSHVRHCPYPVGSLLAYRVMSNQQLLGKPIWGKYFLLRVIKINRLPVTYLAPEAGWSESMLVGLYDWIGDFIPDSSVADSLEYTELQKSAPMLSGDVFDRVAATFFPKGDENLDQVRTRLTFGRTETCCCLDWRCPKEIPRKEVFTYLSCDPSFEEHFPPFFETKITDYCFSHSIPFDYMLYKRFYSDD